MIHVHLFLNVRTYPFGKQLEVENVNKQTFNLKEIKDAGIPDKYCFQDLPFLKLHTVIV